MCIDSFLKGKGAFGDSTKCDEFVRRGDVVMGWWWWWVWLGGGGGLVMVRWWWWVGYGWVVVVGMVGYGWVVVGCL